MSTIKSFDEALDFHPGQPQVSQLSRIGHTIRTYMLAMSEGLAAARTYHELTHRGVPHDIAVQQTFRAHFSD